MHCYRHRLCHAFFGKRTVCRKDKPGLKQLLLSAVKISFGPCLVIAVLTFAFADQIAMLFGVGETVTLVAQALRYFIIVLPFIGIKMFYIYYFQASEHNIGLRIISKKAKSMQYVSVFNLNNFVITL